MQIGFLRLALELCATEYEIFEVCRDAGVTSSELLSILTSCERRTVERVYSRATPDAEWETAKAALTTFANHVYLAAVALSGHEDAQRIAQGGDAVWEGGDAFPSMD